MIYLTYEELCEFERQEGVAYPFSILLRAQHTAIRITVQSTRTMLMEPEKV